MKLYYYSSERSLICFFNQRFKARRVHLTGTESNALEVSLYWKMQDFSDHFLHSFLTNFYKFTFRSTSIQSTSDGLHLHLIILHLVFFNHNTDDLSLLVLHHVFKKTFTLLVTCNGEEFKNTTLSEKTAHVKASQLK